MVDHPPPGGWGMPIWAFRQPLAVGSLPAASAAGRSTRARAHNHVQEELFKYLKFFIYHQS